MGRRMVKKGSWGDNEGMMEMKQLVDTEISAFLEKEWIRTNGRKKTTRSKWRHRQGREGKTSQNSENRIQTKVELSRNRMLVDLIPRTILDSTIHARSWSCEKKQNKVDLHHCLSFTCCSNETSSSITDISSLYLIILTLHKPVSYRQLHFYGEEKHINISFKSEQNAFYTSLTALEYI